MKTKRNHTKNQAKAKVLERERAPLIEHLQELKRRLFYVAVSITIGGGIAFGLESQVIAGLLRPSHGQKFIYTSPMGGINFLFSVCLYLGVALSLPIIVYHFLRFIQPLMKDTTARFVLIGSAVSGVIALIGIVFGYFVGLPAALQFLFHSFHNPQVQALITIQAYMSFVTAYLLGSALMFQLPLFLIFINRIKPLKPGTLLKYERHVIIASIIVGFIMNPSPNIISQSFVVVPIIAMYQVGIGIVWLINRRGHSEQFYSLLTEDEARRTERSQQAAQLLPVLQADDADLTPQRRELELSDTDWIQPERKAVSEPAPTRMLPRAQYDVSSTTALASHIQTGSNTYQSIGVRFGD